MAEWLVQNMGFIGLVIAALGFTVVTLASLFYRTMMGRIASLETQVASVTAKNEELHKQGKADAQANTQALLAAADKTWQGVGHLHQIAEALKTTGK